MQLLCSVCQHVFSSAFGPGIAKCPSCGNRDVRHFGPPPMPVVGVGFAPPHGSVFRIPGEQPAVEPPPNSVPPHVLNPLPWLVTSVVLSVFCQPVGLAGLYFADQAKTLARWGRLDEAKQKLRYAQITVLGGCGFTLLLILVLVALAATGQLD